MILEDKYRPNDLFEGTCVTRDKLAGAIISLVYQWIDVDPFLLDDTMCRMTLDRIQNLTLDGELTEASLMLVPFCQTDNGHFVPCEVKAEYKLVHGAFMGALGMKWFITLLDPLDGRVIQDATSGSSSLALSMVFTIDRYVKTKVNQLGVNHPCTTHSLIR